MEFLICFPINRRRARGITAAKRNSGICDELIIFVSLLHRGTMKDLGYLIPNWRLPAKRYLQYGFFSVPLLRP